MSKRYPLASLSLLTLSILSANHALAAPSDAGSLSKQLQQAQTQPKVQPSGQIFENGPGPQAAHPDNNISFALSGIELLEPNGGQLKDDLGQITSPYLQGQIKLADLYKLTEQITQYYRQQGYLVARAILPPQEIEDGRVKIIVIRGEIGQVALNNQSRLRDRFPLGFASTSLENKAYLNKAEVEKLALLLNDVPGVVSNLSIKAGQEVGQTDLTLNLADAPKRFGGYLMADNQGGKDTGEYRFTLGTYAHNIFGFGDELNLNAISSNSGNLKSARLDYSGLIDGYGSRLGIMASYLNYKLGGNFKDLNAKGNSHTLGAYIQHPTIRKTGFRLDTKLGFNQQKLTDKQEAVDLRQKRTINALTLDLNGSWSSLKNGVTYFGLSGLFGNLHNQTNELEQYQDENIQPKSRFTVFNYSLSHEQSLPKSLALNLGINGQLADKTLDSSQKLLLGGLYAVRGYKSGAVSVDEGHIFQAELKHNLALFKESILTSSVFYDYAWGSYYKNTENLASDFNNKVKVQSIGAGLKLAAPGSYMLNVSYAKPVGKKLENTDKHQVWLSAFKTF
ncbi:hypothetical protein A4G20_03405 [Pasteurellaceae bacterium RH1A]|nr:hypothetical protein A4G20_03405 [Pasteurellaceae bacterium RH1A]